MKYFMPKESISYPGKYFIGLNFSVKGFQGIRTSGSYNILPARLFGLSYADYLRMCRDEYGARIFGKGEYYPLALFDKSQTEELIKELDRRMEIVVAARG